MIIVRLLGAICAIFIASPVLAQSLTVTRKESNLYRVDGTKIWLQTRYCYEYGYGEEVALHNGSVVFLDSGTKCDIKTALKEADISPGSYKISVTHESDEMYSTLEGFILKTSFCLELGVGEEAVFRATAYGGSLIFLGSGRKCQVEQVFSKVRL